MPGPLSGLKGVVLTQVWAGPIGTELLALLGADVIQVESRYRVDPMRGGSWDARIPPKLKDVPTAVHGYNLGNFNGHNLNKKSVTIDLTREEGRDLFVRLVKDADFFVENYSPRVMTNFRLQYDDLKEINPNLIVVNMGAFGHFGRYWNAPGTGGQVEPMAGGTELLGYEDDLPIGSGALWCDPVAGFHAAAAVLTALHHRDVTGEAQNIDVSMQEASALFHSDALMEFSLNKTVRRRLGNRHIQIAPHNTYAAADNEWISIAARNQDEWKKLAEVAGHPEWATDPRFATMADRKQNENALDELITAWTKDQNALALEETLTSAGIAAAKPRTDEELLNVEPWLASGFVQELVHAEAGPAKYFAIPIHLSRTPMEVRNPSPVHGGDSWEVFSNELGMTREEYDALVESGISGEGPPPEYVPGSRMGASTPPGTR